MSFTGGRLKFKGGSPQGGVQKRKKHKGKQKQEDTESEQAFQPQETAEGAALEPLPPGADRRTAAEKQYEEHAAKQEAERIRKQAAKSHRERVTQFNDYLSNLSEHHDIPKVGPG